MDEPADEQITVNDGLATEEILVRWEHSHCGDRQCAARTIRHLQAPSKREPAKLAKLFEDKKLKLVEKWTRTKVINCCCDTEHEAVLVSYELQKRGWKTDVGPGLGGTDINKLEPLWIVHVMGRKPEPAPAKRRIRRYDG